MPIAQREIDSCGEHVVVDKRDFLVRVKGKVTCILLPHAPRMDCRFSSYSGVFSPSTVRTRGCSARLVYLSFSTGVSVPRRVSGVGGESLRTMNFSSQDGAMLGVRGFGNLKTS